LFEKIGIIRESKPNERRSHLAPKHVKGLIEKTGVHFFVQPSPERCFSDTEFQDSGAIITEDLSACDLIIGFKHIDSELIDSDKNYFFAAHMEKGQESSMPLLHKLLSSNCSLFDAIAFDERRVQTGVWAGRAGMIESLYAYEQHAESALFQLKRPFEYISYENFIREAEIIKKRMQEKPFSEQIICGVAGSGNVSQGVNDVLDLLGFQEVDSLSDLNKNKHPFLRVQLGRKERESEEYMKEALQHIDILINGTYWEPSIPRFCPVSLLKELSDENTLKMKLIGDITCDIKGSIECTVKSTTIDDPVFFYDIETDDIAESRGDKRIAVMSIDHLPTEFPKECTEAVGDVMCRYFIDLFKSTDISIPFDKDNVPDEWISAVIASKGSLSEKYAYLNNFLKSER
jgi:alpha-aminoadipic semialdehyde synthase